MTKVAFVLTTVHIPHVLALYRALDDAEWRHLSLPPKDYTRFFVAVDRKTPADAMTFLRELPNTQICQGSSYECSEAIGYDSIQRRNVATLDALDWGADIIVTADDDNSPLGHYFTEFRRKLLNTFSGLQVASSTRWFDVGQLLDPPSPHRGFPHTMRGEQTFEPIVDAKVGVAAGICLGDPDIDSVTRIARGPTVHRVSELLNAGIVVDPGKVTTVWNSQNTAFIRKFAPAMFMLPGIGRHDDIYASLICGRVMRDWGYAVHFGRPYVWQARNPHDLIRDLRAEVFGMEHIVEFADWLDGLDLSATSVLDAVRGVFTLMSALDWMPAQTREAGLAWVSDLEKIL